MAARKRITPTLVAPLPAEPIPGLAGGGPTPGQNTEAKMLSESPTIQKALQKIARKEARAAKRKAKEAAAGIPTPSKAKKKIGKKTTQDRMKKAKKRNKKLVKAVTGVRRRSGRAAGETKACVACDLYRAGVPGALSNKTLKQLKAIRAAAGIDSL